MIRSTLHSTLVLTLVAVFASPALAQEEGKKKKRQRKDPSVVMAERKIANWEKKIQLTDEQKAKIHEIAKAEYPKSKVASDAVTAILTEEQREIRKGAWKQSKSEKIAQKDRKAFVTGKLNLTDEQKGKMKEVDAKAKAVQREINGKMMAALTDEQKIAVAPKRRGKGKDRKKKKEAAEAAG